MLPGDEGGKYTPEGFLSSELGPSALNGKGAKEMEATKEKLAKSGRGGCPFIVA